MELSDHHLVSCIASGDRAAFAAFYDRHAPRVLGLLLKLLRQRPDAEDVLQETFRQVWCSAGQYDPDRAAPAAWLFLIARSRGLDHLRRQRPTPAALPPAGEPTTHSEPSSALESQETGQSLREALGRLPEEQQQAITLAFYAGCTHEQISERLGVALGTIKTRIRLGMKRLRDLLSDQHRKPVS